MSTEVVISGGSGLIGQALTESLRSDGYSVRKLVRRSPASAKEIQWNPGVEPLNPDLFESVLAVVNLNGASIGKLPWTKAYRRVLWDSRIESTRTIAAALSALGPDSPKFVSASAVGFYGNQPGEVLNETADVGDTFLARLCDAWENAALRAGSAARVALLRTAPILDKAATLKPLIPLTKLGVSGPLGGGHQMWPWISLEDEVRAIRHIIDLDIGGPVNLSGPQEATANDIGKELARELKRPFILPVPGWALRAVVGADAANSLLLADADVRPAVLEQTGFKFCHPTVASAISAGL